MAVKKPVSAKESNVFWTQKRCVACSLDIKSMKEALRIQVKDFTGLGGSSRFVWRHKTCA